MKLNAIPLEMLGSTVSVGDLPRAGRALRLERRPDGQLWATQGDVEQPVVAHCCFPWSRPGRFVSLRDPDKNEVALIRDPAELDDRSRNELDSVLAAAGFAFRITRILEVEDEIEIRRWNVDTAQGARSFQTGRDSWPRELPDGGYVIRDVAGDLYHIGDPESLDTPSRKLLWAFVE